jgi:hypothetical protein
VEEVGLEREPGEKDSSLSSAAFVKHAQVDLEDTVEQMVVYLGWRGAQVW